ncbi:hypothetical protein [Gelidibacter sp.]|uniref:hypothetical protein n=1 Tax=Gelidibacter sp. TaxID=2018083 RepID=UPI002C3D5585|nr:hypothetical protein [Gelidibacter sp.]HUH29329.1 hypothetical protein [Gelidibacter sp.]
MQKAFLLFFIIATNLSFGQQYGSLHIEKSKIDKNNTIYTLGKEFVFSIHIRDNNSDYFLKSNEHDDFKLTKNIDSVKISEIHLTVLKPKIFKRLIRNQTQILYSYEPNPTLIATTGLVENDKNVWIHPPRAGFFQSLETCPFPYVKLNKSIGYTWTDSMLINNHWSHKEWGEWEDKLLLNYEYEIVGKENIDSKLGEIECLIINAVAKSAIGESTLKAYFSDKYGFIKLEYKLFSGIEIDLNLEKVIDGPVLRDGKEFLQNN